MIKRDLYLNKIKPFMNKKIIKVLKGVRRCGKSIILEQIIEELKKDGVKEENIILINLLKITMRKNTCFLMKYKMLKIGKNSLTLI